MVDGDYDVLVSTVLNSKIGNKAFSEKIKENSEIGGKVFDDAVKNPKLNISVPLLVDD